MWARYYLVLARVVQAVGYLVVGVAHAWVHAVEVGEHLARGGCVLVTWWLRGGCVVATWWLRGGYVVVAWWLRGDYVDGGYVVVTRWLRGWVVAGLLRCS